MLEITTFLAEYKFWNIRWKVAIDEWWEDVDEIMTRRLREEVPYDDRAWRDPSKPHLRDNLEFDVHERVEGTQAQIEFWGPDLAGLLEEGAPPHEIEGDPLLHFFLEDGSEMFSPSVFHPGFDRIPFVERAYGKSKDEIFAAFRSATVTATIV